MTPFLIIALVAAGYITSLQNHQPINTQHVMLKKCTTDYAPLLEHLKSEGHSSLYHHIESQMKTIIRNWRNTIFMPQTEDDEKDATELLERYEYIPCTYFVDQLNEDIGHINYMITQHGGTYWQEPNHTALHACVHDLTLLRDAITQLPEYQREYDMLNRPILKTLYKAHFAACGLCLAYVTYRCCTDTTVS